MMRRPMLASIVGAALLDPLQPVAEEIACRHERVEVVDQARGRSLAVEVQLAAERVADA